MRFFLRLLSFTILFLFSNVNESLAQLKANAGSNQSICTGGSVQIGSAGATGGKPPYVYLWSPSTGLNDAGISNPYASPATTTTYTLIVKDDTLATDTAFVTISISPIEEVSAGDDQQICEHSTAILGGTKNNDNLGIVYTWSPSKGLNNPGSPHPIAKPDSTVTYTLTATIAGCPPKTDLVTISVIPTPAIYAGDDVTIKEGETITLHATGGTTYVWEPQDSVKYPFTADPDVQPLDTLMYYVYASDPTKTCFGVDSIRVMVEKSNEIVIYNTFTPNQDGNNDTWYIGNIYKYPNSQLEVYNRNGRLVYKARGYSNNWTGNTSGENLPAATYFYILQLGDGKRPYRGTVSIVR